MQYEGVQYEARQDALAVVLPGPPWRVDTTCPDHEGGHELEGDDA